MSRDREVELEAEIERIRSLPIDEVRALWRRTFKSPPPSVLGKDMLGRMISYHIQEKALGGLSRASLRLLDDFERGQTRDRNSPSTFKAGHRSGSRISGRATFGCCGIGRIRLAGGDVCQPIDSRTSDNRHQLEWSKILWHAVEWRQCGQAGGGGAQPLSPRQTEPAMTLQSPKRQRCAIYTRKSTEHNLNLEFNSLDAQREACEAYVKSQAHEGWRLIADHFDDGGLSGASLYRPSLLRLLDKVRGGKIDIILVYKVDRLTRSLADFAKLVELFDQHGVSFVSITQSFNTTSSMGRLTLNVLLSFAQFEREVIGERVRDKIAASKRKGLWVGGPVPLGYAAEGKKLVAVPVEGEHSTG
jgi:DNA invertase Pin-like site-specific DNA recombinase